MQREGKPILEMLSSSGIGLVNEYLQESLAIASSQIRRMSSSQRRQFVELIDAADKPSLGRVRILYEMAKQLSLFTESTRGDLQIDMGMWITYHQVCRVRWGHGDLPDLAFDQKMIEIEKMVMAAKKKCAAKDLQNFYSDALRQLQAERIWSYPGSMYRKIATDNKGMREKWSCIVGRRKVSFDSGFERKVGVLLHKLGLVDRYVKDGLGTKRPNLHVNTSLRKLGSLDFLLYSKTGEPICFLEPHCFGKIFREKGISKERQVQKKLQAIEIKKYKDLPVYFFESIQQLVEKVICSGKFQREVSQEFLEQEVWRKYAQAERECAEYDMTHTDSDQKIEQNELLVV